MMGEEVTMILIEKFIWFGAISHTVLSRDSLKKFTSSLYSKLDRELSYDKFNLVSKTLSGYDDRTR